MKTGMVFAVLVPVDAVSDPDSGEELGRWEAVKGRLMVTHVQPRLAVCGPCAESGEVGVFDAATHTLSAEMMQESMGRAVKKTLNVEKGQLAGAPRPGPIRVGDAVRSVD